MLRTLSLQNFKSLVDTGPQDVEGITVLCGVNSCGKSSFLQALLLLCQSVRQPSRAALTFNGELVRLGSFASTVSAQATSREIRYGLSLAPKGKGNKSKHVELSYALQERSGTPARGRASAEARSVLHRVGVETRDAAGSPLQKVSLEPGYGRAPHRPTVKTDSGTWTLRYAALNAEQAVRGLQTVPEGVVISPSRDTDTSPDDEAAAASAVKDARAVLDELDQWFAEGVRYVGPLRASPSRFYVSESGAPGMGPSGENTIAVLGRSRSRKVGFYKAGARNRNRTTLANAVNYWMRDVFGFRYEFSVRGKANVLFELDLKLPHLKDKRVALPDVGFGISQVLPIVVAGLLSKEGDLLILEQPEIHLHPSVQAKLTDFFLSLVRSGVDVLVETHSEHIVNRVRRRAAEDGLPLTAEGKQKARVLFVEPEETGRGGSSWSSRIRGLDFDSYGGMTEWPAGFCDHVDDELAYISAAADARLFGDDA